MARADLHGGDLLCSCAVAGVVSAPLLPLVADGISNVNVVVVMPVIYQPWADRCLATMSATMLENLIVVDNTQVNRGTSAAWNDGVNAALSGGADWLVILSEAMRFGPPGGDDFLATLDVTLDPIAVEAGHGLGFHCLAFPRRVLETVGRFDENLKAYFEDNDYARRIFLAFGLDPPYWQKVTDLELAFAGFAHAIDLAGVRPNNDQLRGYYIDKWGAPPGGGESFATPFGDPEHDIDWWPQPPDPRSIMDA